MLGSCPAGPTAWGPTQVRRRPQIEMPNPRTPLGKEHAHINESMNRCARHVRVFDAKAYNPGAVESARRLWQQRLVVEYRSTSLFALLSTQLMAAHASLEATSVAFRMAQDELRHAEVWAKRCRPRGPRQHR